MDQNHLEDWAHRVVQELQEFCDDAQQAAGNPLGEDQLPGTRGLIKEFDAIVRGDARWLSDIQNSDDESSGQLAALS